MQSKNTYSAEYKSKLVIEVLEGGQTVNVKLSITLDTFSTRIMKQSGRWQPLRRIFAALQQEESRR